MACNGPKLKITAGVGSLISALLQTTSRLTRAGLWSGVVTPHCVLSIANYHVLATLTPPRDYEGQYSACSCTSVSPGRPLSVQRRSYSLRLEEGNDVIPRESRLSTSSAISWMRFVRAWVP